MKVFSIVLALAVAAIVGSANIALYSEISDILRIVGDARINLGGRG